VHQLSSGLAGLSGLGGRQQRPPLPYLFYQQQQQQPSSTDRLTDTEESSGGEAAARNIYGGCGYSAQYFRELTGADYGRPPLFAATTSSSGQSGGGENNLGTNGCGGGVSPGGGRGFLQPGIYINLKRIRKR
jgi:hypothetical protein